MTIISGTLRGIAIALHQQGFKHLSQVEFTRSPVRIDGMWRCQVKA